MQLEIEEDVQAALTQAADDLRPGSQIKLEPYLDPGALTFKPVDERKRFRGRGNVQRDDQALTSTWHNTSLAG